MQMKKVLKIAATCSALLSATAAEPLAWERTPNRPAPAQFDVFHGESLDFRCTFTGFGALPFDGSSDVRLWYQTNGMGAAWWSIPAAVSSNVLAATFTPDRDPGAERLTAFFGAPSNAYAAAQVRFRNSPGAHPNDLEPPSVIDWQAELSAATNALWASSAAAYIPKTNAYTKAETDARIAELAPRTDLTPATNYTDMAYVAATSAVPVIVTALGGWEVFPDSFTTSNQDLIEPAGTNTFRVFVSGPYDEDNVPVEISGNPPAFWWLDSSPYAPIYIKFPYNETERVFETRFGTFTATRRNALGLARKKDIPTNHVTHAELEEAIGSLPEVDTSNLATKDELSPIRSSVNSMWATLYGENVWIAITNYMRQVANTVPSLRLWEVRSSQTNMVYSSAEEIEHVVTQKVDAAKSEIKGMIPRRAWGSYQSSGEENPSSNAVTVVNSSKIMLTGGGEWYRTVETGGRAIWVIKTNGMMTLGGDTNGNFRVCDAEGNAQIEVVKTADLPVSAVPSATTFVDGNFVVTFNAGGSTHPTASCALDLGDDFETEDGSGNINSLGISISWAKNSDNLWVATVHQDNPSDKLFIYAKVLLRGENLVRNNAPTALDGGIYINNVKYRIVPYSTGGKTYMTLEAWQ